MTSFAASSHNGKTATLSLTTRGKIPLKADAFIKANNNTGFAWVDYATGKAFSVVHHGTAPPNSKQNPYGWHAHVVTLSRGATDPNDFCLASLDLTPVGGIAIHGNRMDVNVIASRLPVRAETFDVTIGFTVQLDSACPAFVNLGQPTDLHFAVRISR